MQGEKWNATGLFGQRKLLVRLRRTAHSPPDSTRATAPGRLQLPPHHPGWRRSTGPSDLPQHWASAPGYRACHSRPTVRVNVGPVTSPSHGRRLQAQFQRTTLVRPAGCFFLLVIPLPGRHRTVAVKDPPMLSFPFLFQLPFPLAHCRFPTLHNTSLYTPPSCRGSRVCTPR